MITRGRPAAERLLSAWGPHRSSRAGLRAPGAARPTLLGSPDRPALRPAKPARQDAPSGRATGSHTVPSAARPNGKPQPSCAAAITARRCSATLLIPRGEPVQSRSAQRQAADGCSSAVRRATVVPMGRSAEKAGRRSARTYDHECLSRREAARRLATGPARIRTLVRRGGLEACTACGRASRVTVASVEAEEAWQAPLFAQRGAHNRREGFGEFLFGLVLTAVELVGDASSSM